MHQPTSHGIQHLGDEAVVVAMRLGAIFLGVAGGVAVASLGTPGLVLLSILLAVAILLRSLEVALIASFGATIALAAWALALVRCEPTMGRACTLDDGSGLLMGWAAIAALLGGATAVWEARPRRVTR